MQKVLGLRLGSGLEGYQSQPTSSEHPNDNLSALLRIEEDSKELLKASWAS